MVATDFFKEQQAAAFLKHKIIEKYLPPYIRKTGSRSTSGRVAYVDGYAGPGTYEDGTAGSPALAVEIAQVVCAGGERKVDGFFVEKDRASYLALKEYLSTEQPDWRVYKGSVEAHLPAIVAEISAGVPAFAFLDPFGIGIPMTLLEEQLLARGGEMRGRARVGGQATEVLLNFSVPGLVRNAGHLMSPSQDPTYLKARATILGRLDASLGGDWWQEIWLSDAPDKKQQIRDGYIRRLAQLKGGYNIFSVPVADRLGGPTSYFLLLLTQHEDGAWIFNNAVSTASEAYRQHCLKVAGELDYVDQKARDQEWIDEIAVNIETELKNGPFKSGDRLGQVYGGLLGVARETHFRRAVIKLFKAGRTSTDFGDAENFVNKDRTNYARLRVKP